MTSRLPTGWQMVSLRRIMQEIERGDPTTLYHATFNYIDIASVDNEAKTISTELNRESRDAPSRARQLVQAGDVVVSTVRPRLNAVALIPTNLENAVASTGFCVLRPKNEILLSDYLFLFCTTPTFINQLAARERGASYPAVTDEDVLGTKIPLPPLSEQRRIVEILNEARDIRRLRQQADDLSSKLVPAIFNEMFGGLNGYAHFPEVVIGKVVESAEYGTSKAANDDGVGVPVLRMNNVTYEGELDLSDVKHIELSETELKKQLLRENDVLFNRTNSLDLVGKTGLWNGRFEAVAASYFVRVRLDLERVDPRFFVAFLNLASTKRRLQNMAKQAIGMSNINATELQRIRMPLPDLGLQRQFGDRVAAIREYKNVVGESVIGEERLIQSMLADAFSGELTSDWRKQNREILARESAERDQRLRENGVKIQIPNTRVSDRLDDSDGRIAALNREQRKLLEQIQNLDPEENGGTFTLSSVSKTLREPLDTLSIDSVRRHLDVLVSLGLIKAVSQRAGGGGSVGFAFGNAYRLPKSSKTAVNLSIEPDLVRSSEVARLSSLGKRTLRNNEAFEAARAMFDERSTSDSGSE